jgi:type III restriction enzyme
MHRLFPQMLQISSQFIEDRLETLHSAMKQDLAINPYFSKALAMLFNAMETVDAGGESREKPILASGAASIRTSRQVNFHTGKPLHDVKKCHLNAAVFDSDWERDSANLLGSHLIIESWVKNDRLGLVVPYRKEGVARKYLPDFLITLVNGEKLLVEIKGQIGDAYLKKSAAERWCRAVTNDGRFGKWSYHLCFGVDELQQVLDSLNEKVT